MTNRLQALDLQGLKTFATITRLEFPGKITAIVGPNGSGKSNIADSIRWVLGEQSFSLLRAKRTEDMIFSGSQQRSRAGMASATITFNNEDGWLPIEFSEVSIARQAYRDGQNEYFLNGQKVRLKDISELLAQTGLSERTYTVIGQGLVDVALALKPDERRKLFEEAAGIGLYRSRKEESLRRLEYTRKNLDRVLDIMTEIKPRLRSLEKQAQRFITYEQLRSDLQVLLREWYGYHWHQRHQDLRTSRFAFQDQEKRLSTLREKNVEAEQRLLEARKELQQTRKSLEEAHNKLSGYHRELEGKSKELAIIEERQRSYQRQNDHLEIDIANLQEEIKGYEAQEQHFKAQIDERMAEFNASTVEVQRIEDALSELTIKRDSFQAQIDALRQSRIELETEKVHINARMEELTNRIATLGGERTKIEASLKQLQQEKITTETQTKAFENNLLAEQAVIQDLQEQLSAISRQIESSTKKKQGVDGKLANGERSLAKLEAELDVLKQAEAALSGYGEGTKKVVENSRSGRLPHGIVPLSQHVIVAKEHEKAISAALGELADLLIIPSKGREIVVEYLDSKNNDRVALVSQDQTPQKSASKRFSQADGVLGYASDLIEVDVPYKGLVENLFADMLVVKDRNAAEHLQSQLSGSEKVVTLNGLVFHANGVMISGQVAGGQRLGRTRRQGEIQQEIDRVANHIDGLEKQARLISEKIEGLLSDQGHLNTKLKAQEEISRSARESLQHSIDSTSRLDEQIRWNQSQLQSINHGIANAEVSISDAEQTLSRLSGEIAAKTQEESEIRQHLNTIAVLEMQQNLNHWKTHRLVAENALEASRQRFQDHHARDEEIRKRLATHQARLGELDANLLEIKKNKAELKQVMDNLNTVIEKIELSEISPLHKMSETNEQQVSALEKLQTHSHQQVVVAERQFTQLQLELSRREDQLNNLQEKIEDDFGLVAYDYGQKMDGPTPLPFGDDLIADLPSIEEMPKSSEAEIKRLKGQIRRIGPINAEAQTEYYEVKERYEFLTHQISDLENASAGLNKVIEELDTLMERDFVKTFKSVNQEFSEYFSRLFSGGDAKLVFSDQDNPVEGGVDIEARLPGRRQQGLALLSGGERSLTAVALIFALLKVSPTPFCVLDEVDAMLDESNVGRFVELLKELSKKIQFVIITHNRNTVQAADVIYGVTMGRDSTSQMISLKLEEVDETYLD
jgi:chromosome segregation protein